MLADVTGDTAASVPPTTAAILAVASILGAVITGWFNRRSNQRRTGPAPTPPDVLKAKARIDVAEKHIADLHDAVIRLQTQQANTDRRVGVIERWLWRRNPPPKT